MKRRIWILLGITLSFLFTYSKLLTLITKSQNHSNTMLDIQQKSTESFLSNWVARKWYNFNMDIGNYNVHKTQTPCIYSSNRNYRVAYKEYKPIALYSRITHNQTLHTTGICYIKNSVAVGMAITSKSTQYYTKSQILQTFPFFKSFLPSFCQTTSSNFTYTLYLAYDRDDVFYTKDLCIVQFEDMFNDFVSVNCPKDSKFSLRFIRSEHKHQPARAQNEAMMTAYINNMEYYFRTNDDTVMLTKDWTIKFINRLKSLHPTNLGVVGPTHRGGNLEIMTYEFVHWTHFHVHGYYYPPQLTDWFADDWITKVYTPNNSVKLTNVQVEHTLEFGTRYSGHLEFRKIINQLIDEGKENIQQYVALESKSRKIAQNPTYVISSSLWNSNEEKVKKPLQEMNHFQNAIRNAQLQKLYMPQWTLRYYIAAQRHNTYSSAYRIPNEILHKLESLGAQLVVVDSNISDILHPQLWKYLAIDDPHVDYFLTTATAINNITASSRAKLKNKYDAFKSAWNSTLHLKQVDQDVVSDWLKNNVANSFEIVPSNISHTKGVNSNVKIDTNGNLSNSPAYLCFYDVKKKPTMEATTNLKLFGAISQKLRNYLKTSNMAILMLQNIQNLKHKQLFVDERTFITSILKNIFHKNGNCYK